MNNLKRILSLALASVMVMGMMVTGASAAFTDAEDITHDAAVDVMNALNIINGQPDGSFEPNGLVTRAQMAKMITFALNGGVDPQIGKPATATFADSANHWAVEYIEYCANLNIIAGRSATEFDPEGKVTAAEAAKMILVALGFDPTIFNLTGANWSKNTMNLAQNLRVGTDANDADTLNLFDELAGVGPNAQLTRDQAAQLIYNGIQSNTVQMALTGISGGSLTDILGDATGQVPTYKWSVTGPSLLETKFGATWTEGVLTAATYNTADEDWTYTVACVDKDGDPDELPMTTEMDISNLFMQNVRVIYKSNLTDQVADPNKTVLAVTSVGNSVVKTTVWGKLALNETKLTVDGYGVNLPAPANESDVVNLAKFPVYSFLNTTAITAGLDLENDAGTPSQKVYNTVLLIDNDGDGKLNCAVVYDITVASVTAVRTGSVNLAGLGGALKTAENDIEAGLAVGDSVTWTKNPETGVYTVKKAETVTGTITATRKETKNIRMDGTWYSVIDGVYEDAEQYLNEDYTLTLVGGYVVAGAPVEGTVTLSDAVMLIAVAQKNVTPDTTSVSSGSLTYREMQVLNSDGEKSVMRVTAVGNTAAKDFTDVTPENTQADDEDEGVNGTPAELGALYTYKADPDYSGCYILTPYTNNNPAVKEMTNNTTAITVSSGRAEGASGIGTFRFEPDAPIFVYVHVDQVGENEEDENYAPAKDLFTVVKGSDVATWGSTAYKTADDSGESTLYATANANGFYYANLGILKLTTKGDAPLTALPKAPGKTATAYGLVLADARRVSANNSTYVEVEVWNGEENVTILANKGAARGDENAFKKGTLVTYTDNLDGTATGLAAIADSQRDAVLAYDLKDTLAFHTANGGKDAEITDDTTIIYVDLANVKGEANGVISLAQLNDPTKSGCYNSNVYVKVLDDEIVYLFVVTGNAISANDPADPDAVKTTGEHICSVKTWEIAKTADTGYAIGDHIGICACGDVAEHHTAANHSDDSFDLKGCTIEVEGDDEGDEGDGGDTPPSQGGETATHTWTTNSEGKHACSVENCDQGHETHEANADPAVEGCNLCTPDEGDEEAES